MIFINVSTKVKNMAIMHLYHADIASGWLRLFVNAVCTNGNFMCDRTDESVRQSQSPLIPVQKL